MSLEIPDDASGDPMYQVTREEDINIAHGDQFVPQVPPPACAGALHTVDVKGFGTDGPGAVENPTFVDIGSSPYEGQDRPLCDTKLVELNQGKSVAPLFNLFTDVPVPSHLRGLIVDDINFATDPRKLGYGEVDGIQFAPIGIYDYTNRLVTTIESDFNGSYDVLLPSTDHISCPTPSGMCANMYRFVANDPGIPGRLNPNWNPRYRSISTEFEALPGVIIPTDLAPTQVGVNLQIPSTGLYSGVSCPQSSDHPAAADGLPALRPGHRFAQLLDRGTRIRPPRSGLEGHPRRHHRAHHLGHRLDRHPHRGDGPDGRGSGSTPARDHGRQRRDHGQRTDLPRPGRRLRPDRARGRYRPPLLHDPGRPRHRP